MVNPFDACWILLKDRKGRSSGVTCACGYEAPVIEDIISPQNPDGIDYDTFWDHVETCKIAMENNYAVTHEGKSSEEYGDPLSDEDIEQYMNMQPEE